MAEYIKREALLEKAWRTQDINGETVWVVDVFDIKAEQAADVAPVVHGRWVKDDEYARTHYNTPRYNCLSCGMHLMTPSFHYCPHCGAKMDLEG